MVPVSIGWVTVRLVLDTGSPFTAIADSLRQTLADAGLLTETGGDVYLLHDVTIAGQTLDGFQARLSRRATRVGVSGVLGLDFLARFTDVHFHVPSMQLSLSD
jgi:hypothetical protein